VWKPNIDAWPFLKRTQESALHWYFDIRNIYYFSWVSNTFSVKTSTKATADPLHVHMYIWALHTCAPLLPSYTVRVMSFKAYQWKLFGLKRFVLQVVQPDDTHFNSVFLETTSWKPVVTTTQIVMDRFTYSVSLKLLLELRIWKNILKMPVTRRVKGCTRLVGKYVTGRRKLFRPHKVYIVLIRICRSRIYIHTLFGRKRLRYWVANYWLKSLYRLQG